MSNVQQREWKWNKVKLDLSNDDQSNPIKYVIFCSS